MKRIYSLDIFRGIAIMMVVVLHRFVFDWTGAIPWFFATNPLLEYPLFSIIMFFIGMGGIFSLISGIVTSYSTHDRITTGRNTIKQIMGASLIWLLWLELLHFIYGFLLAPFGFGTEVSYGFLTALLRGAPMSAPSKDSVLYTGPLPIIGISGLVVPILLYFLLRRGEEGKIRRNNIILFIIGCTILILSIFLPTILEPIMYDALDKNNFLLAISLGYLIHRDFPIFPILSFAIFGSIMGLSLAREEDKHGIAKLWLIFAAIIITVGVILLAISLSLGLFIWNFARFIQLGVYFLIVVSLLFAIDYKPEDKQEKILKKCTPILWFGRTSLTILVLEVPLAEIFRIFLSLIYPGWVDDFLACLLFGLFNLAIWGVILYFWKNKNFKGSLEWIGAQLVKKVSTGTKKIKD